MKEQEFDLRGYLYNNPLHKTKRLKESYNLEDDEEDLMETRLRKAIKTEILSILNEAKDDEGDDEDDVEVEDEDVEVEDEEDIEFSDEDIDMDIDPSPELGDVDPSVEEIQDLLTQSQVIAANLGDEKLLDQIGNTITYFTRAHIVKSTETRAEL